MGSTKSNRETFAKMSFALVYPMYLEKIEKRGRTKEELDQIITWLTGFDDKKIHDFIKKDATFEAFFDQASLNPNAHLITGVICGYRVEDIDDTLT